MQAKLNSKEGLYSITFLYEHSFLGNKGYLPITEKFIGRYGICQCTLPYTNGLNPDVMKINAILG